MFRWPLGSGAVATLLAASMLAAPCWAAKTDQVVLANGDHITGEIKSLEQGRLVFSTDDLGTVSIEWDKVSQLVSARTYEVERSDGTRHFGVLRATPAAQPPVLLVGEERDRQALLKTADVVGLTPLESGRWRDRLDGYLSLGFSYTKANEIAQLTIDAGISRRAREQQIELTLQSIANDSAVAERSASNSLTGVYQRLFEAHWFYAGIGQLVQDDEFGLDLRVLAGGAFGRFLMRSNEQELALAAGIAAAREYLRDDGVEDGLEGLLLAKYALFHYDEPETSVTASVFVLPSLTEWGRVRTDSSVRLRHEIAHDLFTELSISHGYDSEPPAVDAPTSDWSVVTSIGYSF
jgi:uncharacterized protein DUF481